LKRPFLILALVVVVTRVGMLAYVYPQAERLYNGDSWLYEQYALSMLETGEYLGTGFGRVDENPFADMIRPPGLPVLLTVVYAVAGPEWGPWAMMVASLAGNLATLWLMWLLLGMVAAAGTSVGVSGQENPRWSQDEKGPANRHWLWIFALDPVWIMYSKELITEPYFTPLLLGSVYLAVRAVSGFDPLAQRYRSEVWLMGASGLLLGLATLFKPITFYAPWLVLILIPLVLWLQARAGEGKPSAEAVTSGGVTHSSVSGEMRSDATESDQTTTAGRAFWRRWIPALLAFLVAAQLPVTVWQARNYAAHGTWAFTSIAAENVMTGHAAFVLSAAEGITHTEAIARIRATYRERNPLEATYSFDAQSETKMAVAREILSAHPGLYVRAVVRGVAATLLDPGRLVVARTFGDTSGAIGLTETFARDGLGATAMRLLREHPAMAVYVVVYMAFLAGLSVAAAFGAWVLLRRNPALAVILLSVTFYLLVLGSIGGYARFRMYILPFLVMFAAAVPWRARFFAYIRP
jgi:hypothetical protein